MMYYWRTTTKEHKVSCNYMQGLSKRPRRSFHPARSKEGMCMICNARLEPLFCLLGCSFLNGVAGKMPSLDSLSNCIPPSPPHSGFLASTGRYQSFPRQITHMSQSTGSSETDGSSPVDRAMAGSSIVIAAPSAQPCSS